MILEKAIFKIGGSILEKPSFLKNTLSQLFQLVQEKQIKSVIIIPGGGSYANFIREIDKKMGIGKTMAHWMAIYAMDYNGNEIGRKFPSIRVTENFEEIKKDSYPIFLFIPFNHLKLANPLPHSWEVTSDAITIYYCLQLKLKQSYLIKDVDGIFDQNNQVIKYLSSTTYSHLKRSDKLARLDSTKNKIKLSKPIDNYSLELIKNYNLTCVLLNGAVNDQRIYRFFTTNNKADKIYTKISFS